MQCSGATASSLSYKINICGCVRPSYREPSCQAVDRNCEGGLPFTVFFSFSKVTHASSLQMQATYNLEGCATFCPSTVLTSFRNSSAIFLPLSNNHQSSVCALSRIYPHSSVTECVAFQVALLSVCDIIENSKLLLFQVTGNKQSVQIGKSSKTSIHLLFYKQSNKHSSHLFFTYVWLANYTICR